MVQQVGFQICRVQLQVLNNNYFTRAQEFTILTFPIDSYKRDYLQFYVK